MPQTINLTVQEQPPVGLTTEQARVIEAVSPTVDAERTTGGVQITVEDHRGQPQTVTLYDGQTGPQGPEGPQGPQGPAGGVTDVQVNGTSVVSSGIANVIIGQTIVVSGTTPTITAEDNHRYICGEVSTLDITLPASGCIDVVFVSGSAATVLTVTPPTGVTVRWANGFDPNSLGASTTYEINISDGLGVGAAWT